MKLAILACLIFWLSVATYCKGAEVTVAWNPNPEPNITHYRLWRGTELLGETSETQLKVTLPEDRISSLTVTAHNDLGMQSGPSQPLVLMPVTAESSVDLKFWFPEKATFFAVLEHEGEVKMKRFFRLKFNLTPP